MSAELDSRISSLVDRYRLTAATTLQLRLLVERLSGDPLAPTSIRDPLQVVDRHLADSLVALELEPVRHALLVLDLGSGAGVPGLPLAAARPEAEFVLLESSARKCAFLRRAADSCGIRNVRVIHGRAESFGAESFGDGTARHDMVTARAVASLEVTAEYAAPLLRLGGTLAAWGGKRSDAAEAAAANAGRELGLEAPQAYPVEPFAEARHRHLYLMSKVEETPPRFPRRPGMALKRPLGSGGGAPASDRRRR